MKNFALGLMVLGFVFVGCLNTVYNDLPAIIQMQPSDALITEGDTARIMVSATGSKLAFQWIKNDSDTLLGDTLPILTLPNVGFSDDRASYKCRIRNGRAIIISGSARLHVTLLSIPSSVRMIKSATLTIPAITDTSAASHLPGMAFSGYLGDSQTVYFNAQRDTMWFIYQNYNDQLKLDQLMSAGDFHIGTDSLGVHEITGAVTAYYDDAFSPTEKTKYSLGNKIPLKSRLPKGAYRVYVQVAISCFCFPNPPPQYFYAEFNVGTP